MNAESLLFKAFARRGRATRPASISERLLRGDALQPSSRGARLPQNEPITVPAAPETPDGPTVGLAPNWSCVFFPVFAGSSDRTEK